MPEIIYDKAGVDALIAGSSRVLIEDDGAYPARPSDDAPVLFIGTTSPEGLGLMIAGDVWVNSADETGGTGGPITSADVTDFAEAVRDTMGTALVAGSNVTITPDDTANTITISATSGGGGGGALDNVSLAITANQTIYTGGDQAIVWDVERSDASGYHDTVTNPARITVPSGRGGLFFVNVNIGFAGTVGPYEFQILKNGAYLVQAGGVSNSIVVRLAAGDYITAGVWVASGDAPAFRAQSAAGTPATTLTMTRLGD